MKNQALPLLIGLLCLISCTGNSVKNSILKDNIKGKVKILTIYYYDSPTEKFGEIQKGNLNYKSIINYDVNGIKIGMDDYNNSGSFRSKQIYKNDDQGNQIEYSNYSSDGSKSSYGITKYDNQGNKIEFTNYSSNGKAIDYGTYKYFNEGNSIEMTRYTSDSTISSSTVFNFDKKGNCIEVKNYDKNTKMTYLTNSIYDDKGNVLEVKWFDPNGNLTRTTTYNYDEFDEEGNWLKSEIIDYNKPSRVIERKIMYYGEGKSSSSNSQNGGSKKKLNQEDVEDAIKQFVSSNNFGGGSSNFGENGSFNEGAIIDFEPISQFAEGEASTIVHFNYRDAYANSNLVLKFNFKKNIDKQWFLTTVEAVSGVGSQDMSDRIRKWQNINLPVQ